MYIGDGCQVLNEMSIIKKNVPVVSLVIGCPSMAKKAAAMYNVDIMTDGPSGMTSASILKIYSPTRNRDSFIKNNH